MVKDEHEGPVYYALGDFDIGGRTIDLGRGVKVTAAKAVIELPFTMANLNAKSQEFDTELVDARGRQKMPKPPSWCLSNTRIKVDAEIVIEHGHFKTHNEGLHAAWFVMSLFRLWVTSKISLAAVSYNSFTDIAQAKVIDPKVYPLEVGNRQMHFVARNTENMDDSLARIKKHCWDAYDLYQKDARFRLMFDALSDAQYIQNEGLILVSLVAALEGMFCSSQSEVSLRVSSYVACFMAEPGPDRRAIQKIVNDLYGLRSKVAHGAKTKHEYRDVAKAFMIVRRVLVKIIEQKKVPTEEELKIALYGG